MRKPARVFFALCLGSVLGALPAPAQGRTDCGALNSRILKESVRYCVFLPDGYDAAPARRYPILYFLHGLGDNEKTLVRTGALGIIEKLRRQHKIGDFLIAAPAGDRTFYINSADGKVLYSDFLLQEFIPEIESRYRVQAGRGTRGVTGLSMGGYGALRLAFANPEMFSSVSAQSPALITESVGQMFGGTFGVPIDAYHWNANDPLVLAQKNRDGLRSMAVYFQCGDKDDYGFENGAAALHQKLDKEHIKHEYHLYAGDHSLNYFLEHFGETMLFHSRAFDAGQRELP